MSSNPYLSGNFAPVESELSATNLAVTGTIPAELSGRFLRIGPNPVAPDPDNYHWFSGNGMAHGLRLRDGKAEWYHSRFVRDDTVVDAMGWPPVTGATSDYQLEAGVANTNIIGVADKTFAIVEAGGLPVELDYELNTIGRSNFDGTLPATFSAHPHRDPDTGDFHTAAYSPFWQHIQYVLLGADGRVKKTQDIATPGSPMVHDCMFTENFFILLDLPVVFDEQALADNAPFPYNWRESYGARVGLLPRDGQPEDVSWHEVEACYVFHPMNAYEDSSGQVVMDVVRHAKMFATDRLGPNEGATTLDRWTIDRASSKVSERRLSDASLEFPRMDERRAGKSYRWGFSSQLVDGFKTAGIFRHDFQEGREEVHSQGENRAHLEPVFVPRHDAAEEGDGWVMAYVYDSETDKSDVVIIDTENFAGEPVATVHLPRRVPFGFHGNWVADC